jgi:HK97 family phage major capsid protein
MNVKAVIEARQEVLSQMETILNACETGKREMTDDEKSQFSALDTKQKNMLDTIEKGKSFAGLNSGTREAKVGREDTGKHLFTARDLEGYSLTRALNSMAKGDSLSGLEREASDEIAKQMGKSPEGFYFPMELALATGKRSDPAVFNSTTGAGLIPTQTVSFIEALRAKMLIGQLGAQVLTGLVGNVSIPAQTGTATSYWLTEGQAPTASTQTVGQVALAAKTVGAYTDISRRLLNQSSISAETLVRDDLAKTLALAIESAVFNGTGENGQPEGLLVSDDITTVELGEAGAAPTFAKIVALESAVATADADAGSLAYVTNPKCRGKLKTTFATDYNATAIWDASNMVNGYNAYATSLLPSNLTKTTGANLSPIVFGNFADIVLAFWGGLDLNVDRSTGSSTGAVRIVALQDLDIKFRHAASFARILDAVTA